MAHELRSGYHGPLHAAIGRAAAATAVLSMPLLAAALVTATWQATTDVVGELSRAPSLALATVSVSEVVAVLAGAVGGAIATHLALVTVLLAATTRRPHARRTVLRFTPRGWRRVIAAATSGALAVGLAMPASAAPETSDAGWVPQPIDHGTPAPSSPAPPPPAASAPGQGQGQDLRTHVVIAGDSLWSITAETLGNGEEDVDAAAIAAAWPQLFDANRGIVGEDPALIHPGARLAIPQEWTR